MSHEITLGVFFSIFAMVFLAELGDKTQLTALAYTAGGASRFVVFTAASLALVTSTLLAVFSGEFIKKFIPQFWINITAGLLFVIFGMFFIISAIKNKKSEQKDKIISSVSQSQIPIKKEEKSYENKN